MLNPLKKTCCPIRTYFMYNNSILADLSEPIIPPTLSHCYGQPAEKAAATEPAP